MNTTLDSRPGGPRPPSLTVAAAAPDLLDDLRRGQIAPQAALAGGAERAGHPAARLAGHADRGTVRVAHQHAFQQRAVVCPPQRLAGRAVVAAHRAGLGQQRRQQLGSPGQPASAAGCRSCWAHPRSAGRSSAGTAAWPAAAFHRARPPPPRAASAERSARWRGGWPRRGAAKTSGSEDMTFPVFQLSRPAIMTCADSVDFRHVFDAQQAEGSPVRRVRRPAGNGARKREPVRQPPARGRVRRRDHRPRTCTTPARCWGRRGSPTTSRHRRARTCPG